MSYDLRVILRQMRKTPLNLIACLLVLGIGIGGTTAVFSALYTVSLRPLPYPDPGQLVAVHSKYPSLQMDRLGVSPLDYLDLRRNTSLFRNVGGFYYLDLNRTGVRRAHKVNALAVTGSLFKTFGVKPAIGRSFSPAEERAGGPHVVVISDAYWRSAFGHDPNILQRHLELNGARYSVVGVMPPSFAFPNDVTQMWVPVVFQPKWLGHLGRQNVFLRMYARLQDGISFKEASERLDVISRHAAIANRDDYTVDLNGWKYFLIPLHQEDHPSLQAWTWVLFWSVTVLFLIVCLNVGGLLMLRFLQRRFEVSVRLALGSGLLRLALQPLLETGMLCLLGAGLGVLVAFLGVRMLNLTSQFGKLEMSTPVLLFGVCLTAVSMMICSLYPLWRITRASPLEAMGSAGHQRTASYSRQYGRRMVVVLQVAASTTLLVIGGLVLHTYSRLLQTPLGFTPDKVMTMQISLPPLRYASEASQRAFYDTVVDRVQHVPGIREASACTMPPFGYGENVEGFTVAGQPKGSAQQLASVNNVTPTCFRTLSIPLLTGRYFGRADSPGHEYTAIVDQNFASRYLRHQNAVGQQLQMGDRGVSIIGVVGNIKVNGLDVSETPMLYLSAEQMPRTDMSIVVKADNTNAVPEMVQSIVSTVDRDQPIYDVATLQRRIDASLSTRRFVTFLLMSFSALGVVITAIGLYALLSYSIVLRRQEFGIRAALGATAGDLGLLVMGYGMQLLGMGALAGSALAVATARYVSSELPGLQTTDPTTWLWVAGTLTLAGISACAVPAWRASRSNPAALLKAN